MARHRPADHTAATSQYRMFLTAVITTLYAWPARSCRQPPDVAMASSIDAGSPPNANSSTASHASAAATRWSAARSSSSTTPTTALATSAGPTSAATSPPLTDAEPSSDAHKASSHAAADAPRPRPNPACGSWDRPSGPCACAPGPGDTQIGGPPAFDHDMSRRIRHEHNALTSGFVTPPLLLGCAKKWGTWGWRSRGECPDGELSSTRQSQAHRDFARPRPAYLSPARN